MNRMGEGTVGDVRGAGIVLGAYARAGRLSENLESLSRTRCLAFAAVQLLERDAFLAQLDGELGEAGQGHGRLVLVCGEAGIGKTALVDAFSARLSGREQVVWGACDAVTPARPFAPLVDIADQVGGDLRAALRAGDRHRASDAFLGLLRSPASPRVIVFEDVQWIDDATLELLRVTSRRLRTFAALIIATYRDDEVGPGHPLRIALGEVPPTSKVTHPPPAALAGRCSHAGRRHRHRQRSAAPRGGRQPLLRHGGRRGRRRRAAGDGPAGCRVGTRELPLGRGP